MRALAVVLAFGAALAAQAPDDLDRLFHAREWFELRSKVTERSPALMRAAVATAFNDRETAEPLLREIIKSAPGSSAADEAYNMLAHLYRRSAEYSRWMTSSQQWLAAIPGSALARAEAEDIAEFGGRPDQITGRSRHAVLHHDPGDMMIPVSVDGKTDDYVFDTGAWQSVLTPARAARLGLKIDDTLRSIMGSSGQSTRFRTATARDLDVGGTHFRNVSFAVLDIPALGADIDVGIIGIQILVGLGAIRWAPGGEVEIGSPAPRRGRETPNLVFDGNLLLLRTRVLGRDVQMALDTGATTTDLNGNFAETFPQAVQNAKKGTTDITGVGGTKTFDSLEIPEVTFAIGPRETSLRPATITMQRIRGIGGDCCVGNAGDDLLKDGFTIDFSAMTLKLAGSDPSR